ncbi:MAG: hypothetical protein V4662_17265 [Verrucomicrobiota bacterium]
MKFHPSLLLLVVTLGVAGCATKMPDHTKDRSSTCGVHEVAMERKSVPIMYGLPDFNDRTRARGVVSGKRFPHAGIPLEGGCFVDAKNPKEAMMFVCAECQRELREWNEAYDKEHGTSR